MLFVPTATTGFTVGPISTAQSFRIGRFFIGVFFGCARLLFHFFAGQKCKRMFNLSRRFLLKLMIATGFTVLFRPVQALVQEKPVPVTPDRLALNAFIDRLIPADDVPGAGELGITERLLEKAKMNRNYADLLAKGCQWLDRQAVLQGYTAFAPMPAALKDTVIQMAADSPSRSLPRVLFKRVWEDACFYYYSHPEILKRLAYAGPPQPAGFPDHDSPPVNAKKLSAARPL
jgi:hypothetical protein